MGENIYAVESYPLVTYYHGTTPMKYSDYSVLEIVMISVCAVLVIAIIALLLSYFLVLRPRDMTLRYDGGEQDQLIAN